MWLWLFAALAAEMVDIEATGVVQGGQRAFGPSTGVSVLIPSGYTAVLNGATVEIVGVGTASASLSVVSGLSLADAEASTRAGLLIGHVPFQPVGTPVRTGSSVTIQLHGADPLSGGKRVGRAFARVDGQQTIVILASGPASDASTAVALFDNLRGSLQVKGSQASVAPARSPSSAPRGGWADEIRGRQFRYYSGGDSHSERLVVEFCSDGTLWAQGGSSYHTTGGSVNISGAGSQGATGTWTTRGDVVSVVWADGSHDTRTLSLGANGEFLMDGTRWLRADPEKCR